MKAIRNLTGIVTEEGRRELHAGIAVHREIAQGNLQQAVFGVDGLAFMAGGETVIVPMEELWGLMEKAVPQMAGPPASPARPARPPRTKQ